MVKFAAGVVDTSGKFAAGVVNILPPVSLIPVVHLDVRISPQNLEKNFNGLNGILWGWGKLIHEKNQKQKTRDTVPLNHSMSISTPVFSE